MADALLFGWEVLVGVGAFGFGIAGLRLLGFRRLPLAVAGVFGISLWIMIGGWLNYFRLLTPAIFVSLASVGALLALYAVIRGWQRDASEVAAEDVKVRFGTGAKILTAAGAALLGLLMLAGMHTQTWNYDDVQGYAALAVKASQLHSIQPDPFCERRVQAGIGGANFLDAMMLAEGDLRAMPFTDATLGLLLYAMALWAIGRRWRVPPWGRGLALLALPFATLCKVNLTIIYLSAAAFFVLLLLFNDLDHEEGLTTRRSIVLGVLIGAACSTKTPNVVFIVLFVALTMGLLKMFGFRIRTLVPILVSAVVSVVVMLPYMIRNKVNAGTYLYPLLGPGFHGSAYHQIPVPSHLGNIDYITVLLFPIVAILVGALVVTWKLTAAWSSSSRAAVLAFLLAGLIAVPITAFGTGGEGADRYFAPFSMPPLLLFLMIMSFAATRERLVWRRAGWAVTAAIVLYVGCFIGLKMRWYSDIKTWCYEAFGVLPKSFNGYLRPFGLQTLERQTAQGRKVQDAMPAGATAISLSDSQYVYDFRRNTLYIADFPGLASLPPGMPVTGTADQERQYLLDKGIQYIIYDRNLYCGSKDPEDFLQHDLNIDLGWRFTLSRPFFPHRIAPWSFVEAEIHCYVIGQVAQIAQQSPKVYDDGRFVVVKLR